jgi:hypothetical protein
MSIEWDSRSRNLESKIIEQHLSPYDEKKNKKKVIGGSVESFSNIVSVDRRKVKQARSIGDNLLPSYRCLFLELPRDDGKVLMADHIIGSYNQQNTAVHTKCIFTS